MPVTIATKPIPQASPMAVRTPRRALFWPVNSLKRTPLHGLKHCTLQLVAGTCLAPYLEAGDLVMIDPNRTAESGDLAMVTLTYDAPTRLSALGARYPSTITRAALKQLQRDEAGQWWACSNQGANPIKPEDVAGVAVAVTRKPSWRRWRCINAPMGEMNFGIPAARA